MQCVDMVDAMGITGFEGVFRRCCEETIRVLRAEQEAILTILEVFLHDPLYRWTLSSLAALKRQLQPELADVQVNSDSADSAAAAATTNSGNDASSIGNAPATRALLRLKAKIQGVEYGQALSVCVAYTVVRYTCKCAYELASVHTNLLIAPVADRGSSQSVDQRST
jgi:serine-protein kinase ATM